MSTSTATTTNQPYTYMYRRALRDSYSGKQVMYRYQLHIGLECGEAAAYRVIQSLRAKGYLVRVVGETEEGIKSFDEFETDRYGQRTNTGREIYIIDFLRNSQLLERPEGSQDTRLSMLLKYFNSRIAIEQSKPPVAQLSREDFYARFPERKPNVKEPIQPAIPIEVEELPTIEEIDKQLVEMKEIAEQALPLVPSSKKQELIEVITDINDALEV